ncbi:hypothetical protein [Halothiobacillus diazotrophicus]|nr:hypothetical protein [Halothiobacillus diazotrophicus]
MDQRITARPMLPRWLMATALAAAAVATAPFAMAQGHVDTPDVQVMSPYINTAKPGSKDYVHGMSMAQVTKRFGKPQKKLAPVPAKGDKLHPPITRWVYPEFTVYFERHTALHLVRHHPVPKK